LGGALDTAPVLRDFLQSAKAFLQVEQGISEESAYACLRGQSRKRRVTLAKFAEEALRQRGKLEPPSVPVVRDRA
jgi:AmiR/NasT family two-component response regulator